MRPVLPSVKRFLRSPWTIVTELLLVAAVGLVSTVVPQTSDPAALARFGIEHPTWARLAGALGWDRILTSPWMLGALAAAAGSLAVVLAEQWRTVRRRWREVLSEQSFRSAPFRRELVRPARLASAARAEFRSGVRLGLLGSPLFHLGLTIVIVAGVVRALALSDGVVELVSGDALPRGAPVVAARGPGLLAGEVTLPEAVRFDALEPRRYASGALERVAARVTVGDPGHPGAVEINAPLDLGGTSLYLGSRHGPAALVEVGIGERTERVAILLREGEAGRHEASWVDAATGTELRLWAPTAQEPLPPNLEARVVRRGALLYVGDLSPGAGVVLAGGDRVALHGLRHWAVFRVSRDPSRWIAYAGMLLASVGAALMVALVKVDTAVVVRREGDAERVLVALRADRFAPLFSERFEALVRSVAEETT